MMNPDELRQGLAEAIDTEQYYKHIFDHIYTHGIKFLTVNAGAHWLINAIVSHHGDKQIQEGSLRDFQVWVLTVKDSKAVLRCYADTPKLEDEAIITQEMGDTDFPLDEISIYVAKQVIMLPSEYEKKEGR